MRRVQARPDTIRRRCRQRSVSSAGSSLTMNPSTRARTASPIRVHRRPPRSIAADPVPSGPHASGPHPVRPRSGIGPEARMRDPLHRLDGEPLGQRSHRRGEVGQPQRRPHPVAVGPHQHRVPLLVVRLGLAVPIRAGPGQILLAAGGGPQRERGQEQPVLPGTARPERAQMGRRGEPDHLVPADPGQLGVVEQLLQLHRGGLVPHPDHLEGQIAVEVVLVGPEPVGRPGGQPRPADHVLQPDVGDTGHDAPGQQHLGCRLQQQLPGLLAGPSRHRSPVSLPVSAPPSCRDQPQAAAVPPLGRHSSTRAAQGDPPESDPGTRTGA